MEIALISKHALYQERSDNCITELRRLKMIGMPDEGYSLNDEFPDHISKAYLLFGTDCNINCTYCTVKYNLDDSSPPLIMSEETLRHSVDLLFSDKPVEHITLYGGEPMLHRQRLLQFFDSLKNVSPMYLPRIDLITNGTIYDVELMQKFKEYNVFVIISLDGNQEQHDAFRKDYEGKGTFARVIDGIHEYQHFGLSVGVSLVLGRHNYQSIGEICKKMKRELGVASIGITLPHIEPHVLSNREFEKFITNEYHTILEICQDEQLWFEQGMKRLKSLVEKRRFIYGCPTSSKGAMIRILPNGEITLCENMGLRGQFIVGNVNCKNIKKADIIENPLFRSWYSRCTNFFEECRNCRAYAICGMGCPYDAFLQNGTIMNVEKRGCSITKQAIDWFFNRILDAHKSPEEIIVLEPSSRDEAIVKEPWKK